MFMASKPEDRLKELKLTLPTPGKPMARYKMTVREGNVLYVSGHGPAKVDAKSPVAGRVGADLTLEQGKECARLVGLNILSTVRDALGSLDRVKRLVKTLGMVNCTADFKDQPQVINGFSELMAEVFGEDAGVGARSAVGMGSLPANIPVEIECIFEVAP
jgi:enamine deaminase RidA (YjgF/YER057c/UK114 family)